MNNTAAYKKNVDSYFSKSYERITEVATNILKKIKREDLSNELMNFAYVYVLKSEHKPKVYDLVMNGKVEAVVVNSMYVQLRYPKTDFKKDHVFDCTGSMDEFDETYHSLEVDSSQDFDEVLEYEFEIQNKSAHLTAFRETLDATDTILFDLAIVGEYNNSGKLSRYLSNKNIGGLDVNRTSCWYQIKDMRKRIKDSYDDTDI
jgi:hypothetical protein